MDCAKAKCLALTFGDGPGPYTARLLDMLKQRRARATFFVIGRNGAARPWLLRREVAEHYEIGNHTYDHPYLTRLPSRRSGGRSGVRKRSSTTPPEPGPR
ncbi:MAG TPA: polysaccharide deacetylase family protein [Streptosporangiaceae bacterium]